jgi:3-hydroxyacyl-CoA dehydrogenase
VKAESKGLTIRDRLCELDRRGQKTGKGWYDYDENRNPTPSPVTEGIIKEFITKAGNTPRQAPDDEILERCLLPMINEGAKILAERKAIRASDIDIIYQAGYGFPAYRGGPMFYADQMGLDKVVARMKHYAAQWGADFEPTPLLAELAASGKRFQDWRAA